MGLAKTEQELREETRARRAKHDLKNTPLPIKRRRSQKRLFVDSRTSEMNNASLNSLMTSRVMNNLAASRSMPDLSSKNNKSLVELSSRHSKSSVDPSLEEKRRTRSYSRITDQHSSLDKVLEEPVTMNILTSTILVYARITG